MILNTIKHMILNTIALIFFFLKSNVSMSFRTVLSKSRYLKGGGSEIVEKGRQL